MDSINEKTLKRKERFCFFLLAAVWLLRTIFTLSSSLTGITFDKNEKTVASIMPNIIFVVLNINIGLLIAFTVMYIYKNKNSLNQFVAIALYASPLMFRVVDNNVSAIAFITIITVAAYLLTHDLSFLKCTMIAVCISAILSLFLGLFAVKFIVILLFILCSNMKKKETIICIGLTVALFTAGYISNVFINMHFPAFSSFKNNYLLINTEMMNITNGFNKYSFVIIILACVLTLYLKAKYFVGIKKHHTKNKKRSEISKKYEKADSIDFLLSIIIVVLTVLSLVIKDYFSPFTVLAVFHFSDYYRRKEYSTVYFESIDSVMNSKQMYLFIIIMTAELILSVCGMQGELFSAASSSFV